MAKIDDEVKTKFENDKHRFITNLVFTSNWFQKMVLDFLKPYDLSIQQFNVLRILRGANGWKNMNDVKELMMDKTPNTTRLTDKLLKKELIERKRSESDRRVVYVKLSTLGAELLQKIDVDENQKKHLEFMSGITLEEAKQFSDLLDKMRG